ncbi:MAG TPA: hypothetical protein IAC26_06605 [Candidatus Scatomorpha stercoravium]|nr:hypothetical protein [Candidatus Scatomorpha stercoravium]
MKKALTVLLAALLALSLAACGDAGTEPTAAPTEEPAATEPAATEPAAEPEETEPAAEPEDSLLETAKTFEGADVNELIAAIGEPESSDYAPSCLGEGEDGNLYYDGFTVYTYRDTDGTETVNYVE